MITFFRLSTKFGLNIFWVYTVSMVVSLNACTPQNEPKNEAGHFFPRKNSTLNIEFDFPKEWGVLEEIDAHSPYPKEYERGGLLLFHNPLMEEIQCKGEEHCFDTRELINFRVDTINAQDDWAEKETLELLGIIEFNSSYQLIDNSEIIIDGIPVRMITSLSGEEVDGEGFIGYFVDIFIQRKGIGYNFSLSFLRPDQLNGVFHQEFLEILTTIRFVDR